MPSERQLRLVEFVLWVAAVAGIAVAASVVVGLAVGGDLVTVKYTMFVAGVLLFGAGSLAIQPDSPRKDDHPSPRTSLRARFGPDIASGGNSSDGDGPEHRLEAAIQEVPPLRDARLPFDRRIDRSVKALVAGLVVLCVSAIMEFGLGVRI